MHSSVLRLTQGLMAAVALICLTLGLSAHPAHAQAGYYTYTLENASFSGYPTGGDSSGTVLGYFVYNPTTEQFGDFDITTSPGQVFNGQQSQVIIMT